MDKWEIEVLYPMYIRKVANKSLQEILPDFDNYFSDIGRRVFWSSAFKRNTELQLRERGAQDVAPTKPEDWASDHRFQSGFWMLIELELDEAILTGSR
jgi:hypothetical protein